MLNDNYLYSIDKISLSIDVIIVNDSPDCDIIIPSYYDLRVKVFNNKYSRGIHYSRVYGLKKAEGDYILFLDQDDVISNHYLTIQCLEICDNDLCICNGYDLGRKLYKSSDSILSLKDKMDDDDFARLIYPGQVLIRRNVIPDLWTSELMKTSGSDDLFLWMILFNDNSIKHKFNDYILFLHIQNGNNTSNNFNRMIKSDMEVFEILFRHKIICEDKLTYYLKKLSGKLEISKNTEIDSVKINRINEILTIWIRLFESGSKLENYLYKNSIKRIAIYGYGILGRLLHEQIEKMDINIVCVFDKNKIPDAEVEVCAISEYKPDVDLIIITPVIDGVEIEKNLYAKYGYKTILIEELLTSAFELD